MSMPTQEEIDDAVRALIREGHLVAFLDPTGNLLAAPADWAAQPNLHSVALSAAEFERKLSAQEAELMGEWN